MAVGGLHPRVHVRKGDMVEVIGGKHAGRRGKVLEVRRAEGRAIVEGVNIVKRHTKPNPRKGHQGGIMEIPSPLPAARLMVVCPRCGEASRMGRRVLGDGSRVRVCKHCGEQLDS